MKWGRGLRTPKSRGPRSPEPLLGTGGRRGGLSIAGPPNSAEHRRWLRGSRLRRPLPSFLLTRPGSQQVMQHLDVPLEIHGAGDFLAVSVIAGRGGGGGGGRGRGGASPPGFVVRCEQNRTETNGDVLRVHAVEVVERSHQAEVVQEPGQSGLGRKGERGGHQGGGSWETERPSVLAVPPRRSR